MPDCLYSVSVPVSFRDCGQSRVVFEAKDQSHFRVGVDGVLYAARHLHLSDEETTPLVVYARDTQSKQVWKMQVHFILQEKGTKEVRSCERMFQTLL